MSADKTMVAEGRDGLRVELRRGLNGGYELTVRRDGQARVEPWSKLDSALVRASLLGVEHWTVAS